MTELINRDIPIYCVLAFDDEIQNQKALTTKDVWTKRFGFTNFKFYNRIHRASDYKGHLLELNNNLLKTISFRIGIVQTVEAYRAMDLMVLFNKVIANNLDNILIIGHNASLQNDIPASYADNDISFLKIDEIDRVPGEGGFIVSKEYAIAYVDFMMKTYFANDFTLNNFYITCAEGRDRHYDRYTVFKSDCTTNVEDLRLKTNEEMHIIEV